MCYELRKDVMLHEETRHAFNALARETFHLDFEAWYQAGHWSEWNLPYTLFRGERAVANVTVNRLEVLWRGQLRREIQLGGVMTAEGERGRGLSRRLMEEVRRDWAGRCDGMFLLANRTVLDFYPKFGFQKAPQYRFTAPLEPRPGAVRKLDPDREEDRALLRRYYEKTNPFSRLQVVRNFGLLMFYCGGHLKNCVYHVSDPDAVVIAAQEGTCLRCLDVFCDPGRELEAILARTARAGTKAVELCFAPFEGLGFAPALLDDDDETLFVLQKGENLFAREKIRFPEISYT